MPVSSSLFNSISKFRWSFSVSLAGFLLITQSGFMFAATPPSTAHHAVSHARTLPAKPAATHASAKPLPKPTADPNAFIPPYTQAVGAVKEKKYAEAEAFLRQSLALEQKAYPTGVRSTVQKHNLALVKHLLGISIYYQDTPPEKPFQAIPHLKQALATFSQPLELEGSKSERLRENMLLGRLAILKAQYSEAKHYYGEALTLAQSLPNESPDLLKHIQSSLADLNRIETTSDYYAKEGTQSFRWADPATQPVRVYIQDAPGIPGWTPSMKILVQEAYQDWQTASKGQARFEFVSKLEDADTIVGWSETVTWQNDPNHENAQLGFCNTILAKSSMVSQQISISLKNLQGEPLSPNHMYNVALHEVGHSLGVRVHSTTPGDALFPNDSYYSGSRNHPSARDIATVQKLYVLTPDVTNPPSISLVKYSQYFTLKGQAGKVYNDQNYEAAAQLLQQASGIYNRELDTQFLLGASYYMLKQYGMAAPILLKVASQPSEYQGNAVQLAGISMLKTAEVDEKVGQTAVAEEKYRMVTNLLNQHVNRTPMKPEVAAGVQQQLLWLNQREASKLVSSNETTSGEPGKKKKGWRRFFDSASDSNHVPVMVGVPGGFGFGMNRF